jgi:hypothetical protein
MSDAQQLSIWTVYDHPRDYPHCYVARQFRGEQPTNSILISADLEVLREVLLVDMGLTRLERDVSDDPVILETWL